MEPSLWKQQVNDVLMAPLHPAPIPAGPAAEPPGADGGQHGLAAAAIKAAESALSRQRSTSAEFDRRVIEALLGARANTVDGRWRLDGLEYEIGTAAANWDLSTPAGAREFQRFLIGKLGQISAVVEQSDDDDTAKAALAAALAVLYAGQGDDGSDRSPPAEDDADGTARADALPKPAPAEAPRWDEHPYDAYDGDGGMESYQPYATVEPFGAREPLGPTEAAHREPNTVAPAGFPGGLPIGSGSPVPGAAVPASLGGLLPGDLPDDPGRWLDDAMSEPDGFLDDIARDGDTDTDPGLSDPAASESTAQSTPNDDAPPADPTLVRLPGGETVTATSARLAAVLQSAVDGDPIPEAFAGQGITIPVPGTAVSAPIEASRVAAGDIGMFTDRHALAVGNGKAVLDGQIHYVTNVLGPSFLGWQHPPGLTVGEQRG